MKVGDQLDLEECYEGKPYNCGINYRMIVKMLLFLKDEDKAAWMLNANGIFFSVKSFYRVLKIQNIGYPYNFVCNIKIFFPLVDITKKVC